MRKAFHGIHTQDLVIGVRVFFQVPRLSGAPWADSVSLGLLVSNPHSVIKQQNGGKILFLHKLST